MTATALREFAESTARLHAAVQRLESLGLLASPAAAVGRVGRSVKCTQLEFDKLPALVGRQEFMDWTGYDKDELGEEVKLKRIAVYKPPGRIHAKYYKHEIARLGNWKM